MTRSFLAIAVMGLLSYGIYQFLQAPAEATPLANSAATPEQQFQKLLSLSTVPSDQLYRLCNAYPQIAARFLKNHSLRVSSTVQDLLIAGLDGRRAVVTLEQSARRKLVVIYDLNHYATLSLDPLSDHRIHYVIVGNELLRVTPPGFYRHGNKQRHETVEEIRRVMFTRTLAFEDTATFVRITPDAIVLEAAAH